MRQLWNWVVLLLVASLISVSCNVRSSGDDTAKAYALFTERARAIHEQEFNPEGFSYLNDSLEPVTHIAYWQSQFEPKTSDQYLGQERSPTRFEYNYLSADGSVLILLRFVFVPWEQPERIAYMSIISPNNSGIPGGTQFLYPLQQEVMYSLDYGYMVATGFLVRSPGGLTSEEASREHLAKTFYPFQQELDAFIGKMR